MFNRIPLQWKKIAYKTSYPSVGSSCHPQRRRRLANHTNRGKLRNDYTRTNRNKTMLRKPIKLPKTMPMTHRSKLLAAQCVMPNRHIEERTLTDGTDMAQGMIHESHHMTPSVLLSHKLGSCSAIDTPDAKCFHLAAECPRRLRVI